MKMHSVTCCAALLFATFIFGISSDAKGQEWRRIVPLHSTCEDARRILNLTKCEPSMIELQDVSVFVIFSTGPCTSEWNVPTGTVLTLDVQPKKHLRLSDLQIDETKYSKQFNPNVPNTTRLSSPADGVSIDLFEDGRIRHIFYGPSSRDQHLRCDSRAPSRASGTGSMKIDQYDFIPFHEERLRLDEFATTLTGWTGATGYVVVYPGRNVTVKQAQYRASRAQSYLRRKKGLRSRVVLTIIGGGREEPSVELFITVKNGSPPVVSPARDMQQRRH